MTNQQLFDMLKSLDSTFYDTFFSQPVQNYRLKIKCVCKQDSGEGNGTPFQYSRLENPMDGGSWQAAAHGVVKSQTRLSNFTFTFHFHALEKEMATHSSVLAWRNPGMGQPGGCRLWGHTESDMIEVPQQQQQQQARFS